jgi:hypothetical protein
VAYPITRQQTSPPPNGGHSMAPYGGCIQITVGQPTFATSRDVEKPCSLFLISDHSGRPYLDSQPFPSENTRTKHKHTLSVQHPLNISPARAQHSFGCHGPSGFKVTWHGVHPFVSQLEHRDRDFPKPVSELSESLCPANKRSRERIVSFSSGNVLNWILAMMP